MCGTPLALATEAPQAQREREFIQRQINACRSKDQVKAALVAQFGDRVLALPGDENGDFGDVLVYLIPALGVLLARGRDRHSHGTLRRRGASARPAAAAPPAASAGSTPTSTATTCDRRERHRRHTTVVTAFGVGFISFISPCVLPLVPGYLSTISGVSFADIQEGRSRTKVLGPALLFCLSFTAMFVALGMTATGLGQTLHDHRICCARSPGSC